MSDAEAWFGVSLSAGDEIDFRFALPQGTEEMLDIEGTVVWANCETCGVGFVISRRLSVGTRAVAHGMCGAVDLPGCASVSVKRARGILPQRARGTQGTQTAPCGGPLCMPRRLTDVPWGFRCVDVNAGAIGCVTSSRIDGRRRFQGDLQHLVHGIDEVQLHRGAQILRESPPGPSRCPSAGSLRRSPARCAASSFSFRPPIGSTLPRSVISPVIARSRRTGILLSALAIAVAIVMPADGPSFGIAPSGTCTWMSRLR